MTLPYGAYSDEAFEKFSKLTDDAAKKKGKTSLLLCDVSGKLTIWNTSEKGKYTGKQKIVYKAEPDTKELTADMTKI